MRERLGAHVDDIIENMEFPGAPAFAARGMHAHTWTDKVLLCGLRRAQCSDNHWQ